MQKTNGAIQTETQISLRALVPRKLAAPQMVNVLVYMTYVEMALYSIFAISPSMLKLLIVEAFSTSSLVNKKIKHL